jgi:hypothetical protein
MKTLTVLAASLLTSIALASPALAKVPYCDWTGGSESERAASFAQLLGETGKFGTSVVVWNGCFKVQRLRDDGTFSTEYYDPDSRRLID